MKIHRLVFLLMYISPLFANVYIKANLVGQAIWQSLPTHEDAYIDSFIKGMQSNDPPMNEQDFKSLITKRRHIEKLITARKNLSTTEKFFSDLKKQKNIICILPNRIYYRQINPGDGETIQNLTASVVASYEIRTLEDKLVTYIPLTDAALFLPLSEMIPGLAKGMVGMREGETREIFVHPEYGYSGPFEENLGFVIKTELKKIRSHTKEEKTISPLRLMGANFSEKELSKEHQELQKQIAYQYGIRVWEHYKRGEPEYTLENVLAAIKEAQQGKYTDLSSPETQAFLVDLHWMLYSR